ncbi:MAG: Gfo/Idh/MocA family oxidoreductase [Vicinamibacterales bacterium]|nr:Gfo/Idh/MocA family oxidoreductase [Vicinamibacterales bacterium]
MTAPDAVKVVLVGVGGYGAEYLAALQRQQVATVELTGAVDPFPRRSRAARDLADAATPVRPTLDAVFDAGAAADLVIIASPIHHHVRQSLVALQRGCHVLCDKPLGATIQQVGSLIRGRDESGCWVRVGYQWSYAEGIRALKRDIQAGRFGAAKRAKTICLWPRTLSYYRRNDWAGRLRDPATGAWVLDSPINNAQAHFLHNLFFLLGPTMATSAMPVEVTAEACRANGIESFDTVACRAGTDAGVDVLFYGSHASRESHGPQFELEFEDARVSFAMPAGDDAGEIAVEAGSRRVAIYPSPEASDQFVKLDEALGAVATDVPVVCGPEAASAQTLCVNGVHESVPEVVTVPTAIRRRAAEPDRYWIEGLDEDLRRCYARGALPSEAGLRWAVGGRTIDLSSYDRFPASGDGA